MFKNSPNLFSLLLLCFTCLSCHLIHAQTFNWNTATGAGTPAVTETIAGVTATASISNGNNLNVSSSGNLFGTSGNIVNPGVAPDIIVSFDVAIDISSITVFDINGIGGNWTITPTGGNNTALSQAVPGPGNPSVSAVSVFNVNWTNITSFTITNDNGSDDAFGVDVINFTASTAGIEEDQLVNAVQLYPNPTANFLSLSNVNGDEQITVYNTLGQLVKKATVTANQNINVSDLKSGLYYLKLSNNDATFKFLKK
ncbi:T9SS type A sorting domain-containing protein [Nonlabens sp.]|uniref:T9SS type A sorting domain-containing protein n=1 Tax=Nonlabens sp. TaxID=1888209 RepID=UPI0032671C65